MAKIKFVATDMDGTLLNSKKEIHEEFYEVFREMREKDIIFAAASGRQYYSLLETFDNKHPDNDYFVKLKGENGFEDKVSYLDETSVEENESKIRFVIGNGGVGSSREIILSAGGSKMSYITGIQKDDDKGFVDKTIECTKM